MADQAQIEQFIMDHLKAMAEKAGAKEFTAQSNVLEDGILDSLGLLELVSSIEKEFGVSVEFFKVEPEEFETAGSVAAALARVAS